MAMLKVFGWLFAGLGAAALAADIATVGAPRALGAWWADLHRDSLQLAQPAIERHLSPWLWDAIVLPLLLAPAAWVGLGLGASLLALGYLRR